MKIILEQNCLQSFYIGNFLEIAWLETCLPNFGNFLEIAWLETCLQSFGNCLVRNLSTKFWKLLENCLVEKTCLQSFYIGNFLEIHMLDLVLLFKNKQETKIFLLDPFLVFCFLGLHSVIQQSKDKEK